MCVADITVFEMFSSVSKNLSHDKHIHYFEKKIINIPQYFSVLIHVAPSSYVHTAPPVAQLVITISP